MKILFLLQDFPGHGCIKSLDRDLIILICPSFVQRDLIILICPSFVQSSFLLFIKRMILVDRCERPVESLG